MNSTTGPISIPAIEAIRARKEEAAREAEDARRARAHADQQRNDALAAAVPARTKVLFEELRTLYDELREADPLFEHDVAERPIADKSKPVPSRTLVDWLLRRHPVPPSKEQAFWHVGSVYTDTRQEILLEIDTGKVFIRSIEKDHGGSEAVSPYELAHTITIGQLAATVESWEDIETLFRNIERTRTDLEARAIRMQRIIAATEHEE